MRPPLSTSTASNNLLIECSRFSEKPTPRVIEEPEDHTATLSEAMTLIVSSPKRGFEIQRRFFSRRIDPWMPGFCKDMAKATDTRFRSKAGIRRLPRLRCPLSLDHPRANTIEKGIRRERKLPCRSEREG